MNTAEKGVPSYILLLALLSLLAMFAASFQGLTDAFHKPAARDNAASPDGAMTAEPGNMASLPDAGPGLALTEQQADDMTGLMRKLQSNPNDFDALMEISDIFIMAKDWNRAENFLVRAALSRPADLRPRYMLGIAQYQQKKWDEAAKSFEEVLVLKEDPAALYNLAVIYKYHLNKQERATELLDKILQSPDADLDTLEKAKKER